MSIEASTLTFTDGINSKTYTLVDAQARKDIKFMKEARTLSTLVVR